MINILQGAGTAVGELPPYFMARAARLSGADLEEDEFEEIEELLHEKQTHPHDMVGLLRVSEYSDIRGSEYKIVYEYSSLPKSLDRDLFFFLFCD